MLPVSAASQTPSAVSHRGRGRPSNANAEQPGSGRGRGRSPGTSFRASQRDELRRALVEQQVCRIRFARRVREHRQRGAQGWQAAISHEGSGVRLCVRVGCGCKCARVKVQSSANGCCSRRPC